MALKNPEDMTRDERYTAMEGAFSQISYAIGHGDTQVFNECVERLQKLMAIAVEKDF